MLESKTPREIAREQLIENLARKQKLENDEKNQKIRSNTFVGQTGKSLRKLVENI